MANAYWIEFLNKDGHTIERFLAGRSESSVEAAFMVLERTVAIPRETEEVHVYRNEQLIAIKGKSPNVGAVAKPAADQRAGRGGAG